VLGQRDHARAVAGTQRGGQWQGICVEMTLKECCPYVIVLATLEMVGQSGVHAAQEGSPAHDTYEATRARRQGYTGA
jgi:hypothetical protein